MLWFDVTLHTQVHAENVEEAQQQVWARLLPMCRHHLTQDDALKTPTTWHIQATPLDTPDVH